MEEREIESAAAAFKTTKGGLEATWNYLSSDRRSRKR